MRRSPSLLVSFLVSVFVCAPLAFVGTHPAANMQQAASMTARGRGGELISKAATQSATAQAQSTESASLQLVTLCLGVWAAVFIAVSVFGAPEINRNDPKGYISPLARGEQTEYVSPLK